MGSRSFLACAVLVLGASAWADGTGYEEPWNAFRAGDYAGSASALAGLLTASPEWVDGHLLSAQCSYLLGDPAGAERAIDRALELDPAADAYATYLRAGRLLYAERRFDEAVRPLELALKLAEPDKRRATVEQLGFARSHRPPR